MLVFQIIAFTLCLVNVLAEFIKSGKEVNEKTLLWVILATIVIK